jgi:hypothetical protein
MGDDNKKSFWTSLPGILTGIAAVVVAIGSILAAYNHITPSPPTSTSPSPPSPASPAPSSSSSSPLQIACGSQLPGVMLFGSWRWSGTVGGTQESGVFTFKNDCTYTSSTSGVTGNVEGTYLVSSSPDPSITSTDKNSGQKHIFMISKISENSFHASSPDYTINLDFFKP